MKQGLSIGQLAAQVEENAALNIKELKMGDRGNIKFVDNGEIYFYSHWGGSELKTTLANALERGKSRWDDGQYLARIIFCEMVNADVMGTTGYGISTYLGDNEYEIITVNVKDKTVQEGDNLLPFKEFVEGFKS